MSSYEPHTRVFDFAVEELGTVGALVYGVIWRHYKMRDGDCHASVETLAEKTGLGKSTVRKYIQILEDHGYILQTRGPSVHEPPHYICMRGPDRVLRGSTLPDRECYEIAV